MRDFVYPSPKKIITKLKENLLPSLFNDVTPETLIEKERNLTKWHTVDGTFHKGDR